MTTTVKFIAILIVVISLNIYLMTNRNIDQEVSTTIVKNEKIVDEVNNANSKTTTPTLKEKRENHPKEQEFLQEKKNVRNNCDQLIEKKLSTGNLLTICYDYKYNAAKYVSYTLDGNLVNKLNIKKKPRFHVDPKIPQSHQISSNDYKHSGYSRGHLASDGSFDYDEGDLKMVYSMANVIPQDIKINNEFWTQIEDHARKMAVKFDKVTVTNVIVFGTNPTYIGNHHKIAVPTGFTKKISNKSKGYEECFYYDNYVTPKTSQNIKQHKISCSTM